MGLKQAVLKAGGVFVPKRHRRAVRAWLNWHFVAPFYVGSRYECPCCGGRFRTLLPYWDRLGQPSPAERCPRCWSLSRHRLLTVFLERHLRLGESDSIRLLHFAPEPVMMGYLRRRAKGGYVTADLHEPFVDHNWDIMNIDCPDESFDAVVCYHVLEHLTDDRRAMAEVFRILRPGGWAILQPPVYHMYEETIEDPSEDDPAEQHRRFGWEGHLRRYGRDIRDRFVAAGFEVEEHDLARQLDPETTRRWGLDPTEVLYFLRKPRP